MNSVEGFVGIAMTLLKYQPNLMVIICVLFRSEYSIISQLSMDTPE